MVRTRSATGIFLALHAALIAVSCVAFWLIVDRPMPAWAPPERMRAYAVGMAWTGPLYIVTGFVAALLAWIGAAGVRRGAAAAGAVVAISLGVELVGVSTGLPFGEYGYGTTLGPRVLGIVPAVIPLSWFMMLYASLGIAARFRRGTLATAAIAALGLVAWDVLMDPAMSAAFPFWSWHQGGEYFGMPLLNWAGWMLTGVLIALPALWIARYAPAADPATLFVHVAGAPSQDGVAGRLLRQRTPELLYLLNGLFPLVLALARGMVVAAVVGGIAMALFLVAPRLSRPRPAPALTPAPVRQHS